jgi:hypothetical protein
MAHRGSWRSGKARVSDGRDGLGPEAAGDEEASASDDATLDTPCGTAVGLSNDVLVDSNAGA